MAAAALESFGKVSVFLCAYKCIFVLTFHEPAFVLFVLCSKSLIALLALSPRFLRPGDKVKPLSASVCVHLTMYVLLGYTFIS